MAENSKIEWTKHTANLWWGCTEVHAGCDNCYARVLSHRWGFDIWGNDKPRRRIQNTFNDLDKYQRIAAAAGEVHRVFINSMSDLFEKSTLLLNPFLHYTETEDIRQEFFTRIDAGLYPNLMLLLLTKRPSNIPKMVPAGWLENPPSNIMYGTSPVDQKTANTLIIQLLKIKGKKFLSVEPQIEQLTLMPYLKFGEINWVIQGGESGGHKRPFNTTWARLLRNECMQTNTPYFFKQIDKIQEIPEDLQIREFPS